MQFGSEQTSKETYKREPNHQNERDEQTEWMYRTEHMNESKYVLCVHTARFMIVWVMGYAF